MKIQLVLLSQSLSSAFEVLICCCAAEMATLADQDAASLLPCLVHPAFLLKPEQPYAGKSACIHERHLARVSTTIARLCRRATSSS